MSSNEQLEDRVYVVEIGAAHIIRTGYLKSTSDTKVLVAFDNGDYQMCSEAMVFFSRKVAESARRELLNKDAVLSEQIPVYL